MVPEMEVLDVGQGLCSPETSIRIFGFPANHD